MLGIVGIEPGSLRRLEQGIRRPSRATLEIIRAAYGPALDQAEKQLGYALNLAREDFHASAGIQARITDIRDMRQEMKDL